MSKFFKKGPIRFRSEITPGICPHCELPTSFGFIYDAEKDMRGTSEWIKYKSLIYIAE